MTNEQEKVFWAATREYANANAAIAIEREHVICEHANPNRDPDIRMGRYAKYDPITGERLPK